MLSSQNTENRHTTVRFQIIMLALSLAIAYVTNKILLKPHNYTIIDRQPELTAATEQEVPAAHKVATGIRIDEISKFSFLENQFILSAIIWFEFDPTKISQDDIEAFSIERAEFISRKLYNIHATGTRTVVSYDVTIKLSTLLDYQRFPLDDHRLNITIINNKLTAPAILFTARENDFVLAENAQVYGWSVAQKNIHTGYNCLTIGENSQQITNCKPGIIFSIDYSRTGFRSAITILFPILLIFCITIFSLSLDPASYRISQVGITLGSITALLSFRFVIENLSPKVNTFMLCDYFFFTILLSIFVVFFVAIKSLKINRAIKNWITIALYSVMLAITTYLRLFWLR